MHTVGPDFRSRPGISRDDAVQILAETYCNVLTIAAQVGMPKLRLLPISGGIYAGVSVENKQLKRCILIFWIANDVGLSSVATAVRVFCVPSNLQRYLSCLR